MERTRQTFNEDQSAKNDKTVGLQDIIVRKAIYTKTSINAYFKGEITIVELNARGIRFVNTI